MANVTFIGSMAYSEILDTYGVQYSPYEYYWKVGDILKTQGWILHLSVIACQIDELLTSLVPKLIAEKVPFKIVRDKRTAQALLEGTLGYMHLGKIVSIYPENDTKARTLAKQLLEWTSSYRGPAIPTDRHLGGIVYTRYGSFNPILNDNGAGQSVKCIYDATGQLIVDPYYIPFQLSAGIDWPFPDIASPLLPPKKKLINAKYYPLITLKPDSKGEVVKALYFKKIWQIKSCLLKQGHQNMFADDFGRDIQDRLKWQYDLYQELKADIPMPEVFDIFSENGDAWIAMDFINGVSLKDKILEINQDKCWSHLPSENRHALMALIVRLVQIIKKLHEKGYVHRDITPANFIIDKKDQIFLIDMELAWPIGDQPTPPFELGTPGYMSPEQFRKQRPTVKEDIYGFGALLLTFFTNLYPTKFDSSIQDDLEHRLLFFTGDRQISNLTARCMNPDPVKRPELLEVEANLQQYRNSIKHQVSDANYANIDPGNSFIQRAIDGMALSSFLDDKSRWVSFLKRTEDLIGNQQAEGTIYEGWHTGVSGPLWMLALAKKAGYSIEKCLPSYYASWTYIKNNSLNKVAAMPGGLYHGKAGVALAMAEGITSGLLDKTEYEKLLYQCFNLNETQLSLAYGIAGQGMSLMSCSPLMNSIWVKNKIEEYVNTIIKQQLTDGSWGVTNGILNKKDIITGIDLGVAGITWFLLKHYSIAPTDSVKAALEKSLQWLIKNRFKKVKAYTWGTSTKESETDDWTLQYGKPGIALIFIKAYELFRKESYREVAENILISIEPFPVRMDYSLASGLAGLGEVYLDAYEAFPAPRWKERASWIANLLKVSSLNVSTGEIYWLPDMYDLTCDLFVGTGGILHFLMRQETGESLHNPLWSHIK